MVDYEFKAYVLREHKQLLKQYKKARLKQYLLVEEGIILNCPSINDLEFDCIINKQLKELNEVERIFNATNQRTKRLRKKVSNLIEKGPCLFLTLTFKNKVLEETNKDTRRQYIRKCLKTLNSGGYVANIDYGGKRGREHYHAIVQIDHIDNTKNRAWPYGNLDFEIVRVGDSIEDSMMRIPKYISKLTNHAIKNTTKRECIIYSR